MALTPDEVARLGHLARIRLSDEECALLAPQLDLILESVAVVSEVARADVNPTSHALDLTNVFREDAITESMSPDDILAGAPRVEDQRFRVPHILAEEAE